MGNRGCKGVEANQDYQGAQCTMFANSSVDRWLSHATYGGGWHDTAPSIGPGGEVWTLKQMSAVGARVIGVPAFSVGVKGGFSPPLLPLNESAAKGLNCSQGARTPPFGTLPEVNPAFPVGTLFNTGYMYSPLNYSGNPWQG
jgi:hypothetical protein